MNEITPELKKDLKTIEKQKHNPVKALGEYAIKGGPGRPKNAVNKFTDLKNGLADAWARGKGKQRLEKMLLEGSNAQFIEILKVIADLLPKEQVINADVSVGPRIVIIRPGEETKEV